MWDACSDISIDEEFPFASKSIDLNDTSSWLLRHAMA